MKGNNTGTDKTRVSLHIIYRTKSKIQGSKEVERGGCVTVKCNNNSVNNAYLQSLDRRNK